MLQAALNTRVSMESAKPTPTGQFSVGVNSCWTGSSATSHVIKRIFGFVKVSYRGLEKNANRLFVTCALANLYVVRGHLLARARA